MVLPLHAFHHCEAHNSLPQLSRHKKSLQCPFANVRECLSRILDLATDLVRIWHRRVATIAPNQHLMILRENNCLNFFDLLVMFTIFSIQRIRFIGGPNDSHQKSCLVNKNNAWRLYRDGAVFIAERWKPVSNRRSIIFTPGATWQWQLPRLGEWSNFSKKTHVWYIKCPLPTNLINIYLQLTAMKHIKANYWAIICRNCIHGKGYKHVFIAVTFWKNGWLQKNP